MPTPVFTCGFECGASIGNQAGGGGLHWTNSGTASFDTGTVRTGLRSARCNPSAATGFFFHIHANNRLVGRLYVRFATLPTADRQLIFLTTSGLAETNAPSVFFKSSDSKLYASVGTTLGASGVSVTTGVWYRLDFDLQIATGGNDTADLRVDGTAVGQATATGLSSSGAFVVIGFQTTNGTGDVFFEDSLFSVTGADYPLGAGYVKSYIPNADGGHNVAGANDFERTLTGTDITNATTDAYELVNDRPIETVEGDFIRAVAPPNSTDYVEVAFEDSSEPAAPRCVQGLSVHHTASGSGTTAFSVVLRDTDGGTQDFIASTSIAATIFLFGITAIFNTIPGTANAWTLTAFNALRARFLVSDASPDPYLDGLMLEAEYEEVAVASNKAWYHMHQNQ